MILILIILIILILLYIIIYYSSIKEGLDSNIEYKNYDKKCLSPEQSAFMLAEQNAGNIEYLKQQVNRITELDKQIKDMSGNIVTLNEQVIGLVNQQSQAASQLVGNKPIQTSGLSSEEPVPSENIKSAASKSEPLNDNRTNKASMGSSNVPKSITTFS